LSMKLREHVCVRRLKSGQSLLWKPEKCIFECHMYGGTLDDNDRF
jgi:hypothetical protein